MTPIVSCGTISTKNAHRHQQPAKPAKRIGGWRVIPTHPMQRKRNASLTG